MDIQNVKVTLGRVRARGALALRQGSAVIDDLSEALPLAPTPRLQKPVLLVLGVAPALVGAVELALRAMRIDLPAVQPPAAVPAVVATILASLLGFYLASATIVLHQSLAAASWRVRSYVFTNYQARIQVLLLVFGVVANVLLLWAWSAGAPASGPFVALLYVELCGFAGGAFYRLMRDTSRMHDPATLVLQPARNVLRFTRWLEGIEAPSEQEARRRIARVVGDLDCLVEIAGLAFGRAGGSPGIPRVTAWSVCESLQRFSAHRHKVPITADWSTAAEPYYMPASLTAGSLSDALRPQPGGDAAWFARRAGRVLGGSVTVSPPGSPPRMHDGFLPGAQQAVTEMSLLGDYQGALTFIDEIAACAHPGAADVVTPLVAALMERHAEAAQAGWPFHKDDVGRGARLLAMTPPSSPAAALPGPPLVRAAGQRIHADRHLAWRVQHEPPETVGLSAGTAKALRQAQAAREPDRERYARAALSQAYSEDVALLVEEWARRARDVDTGRFSGELPAAATAGIGWLAALDAMASASVAAQAHRKALEDLASVGLASTEDAVPAQDASSLMGETRHAVLEALASTLADAPAEPDAAPDYRGAVALTLAEALGRDLARRDNDTAGIVFPKLLASALETAAGPWREGEDTARGLAIAPLLAVIALSGLALAYEELRADEGAAAVSRAWGEPARMNGPWLGRHKPGLMHLTRRSWSTCRCTRGGGSRWWWAGRQLWRKRLLPAGLRMSPRHPGPRKPRETRRRGSESWECYRHRSPDSQ